MNAAAEDNSLVLREGAAKIYPQMKAKARWQSPGVPEYYPHWLVRFHVLGKTWEERTRIPVALGMRTVKVWAKERIQTEAHLLLSGKMDELRKLRAPKPKVTLEGLLEVYLKHVPSERRMPKHVHLRNGRGDVEMELAPKADYLKNASRLRAICEEATGLAAGAIVVQDETLTQALVQNWVRMRQEYFRKGWTQKGKAPENAWDLLRAELKAGKLPGIDKTTVMEGNTTIQTYLRCAKSVFANGREYLTGLELPELKGFLAFRVVLAAPEGHREISADAKVKLKEAEAELRRAKPAVWAFGQVVAWTAARPVTVLGLAGAALTVQADGSGVLAVPAAKGGKPVLWPIGQELTAVLAGMRTEASLFGAVHKTAAKGLWMDFNAHLTACGVVGTHKTYLLRHARGQQLREAGGSELAADGLGHKSTTMVQRKYTKGAELMPMLVPGAAAVA